MPSITGTTSSIILKIHPIIYNDAASMRETAARKPLLKRAYGPAIKQTGRPLSFDKGVAGKKSSVTLPVDTWVVLKEALLRTCPEFRTQNELINAAVLEYVEKRKNT